MRTRFGAGRCCCGDEMGSSICVNIHHPCNVLTPHADDSVSLQVFDPETGALVAGNSKPAGPVSPQGTRVRCVRVPPGTYNVAASVGDGCGVVTREGVVVAAGVSVLIEDDAICDPTGKICVYVYPFCPDQPASDAAGVTVTVPGVGSKTTDADGKACFEGLEGGDYSVSLSNPGFKLWLPPYWLFGDVGLDPVFWGKPWLDPRGFSIWSCGGAFFAAQIFPDSVAGARFLITGCHDAPIPGAAISIKSLAGEPIVTVETGSDGKAEIPPLPAGTYSYSIEPPHGERFADAPEYPPGRHGKTGTFEIASACEPVAAYLEVGLVPADGYVCCEIQKAVSPTSPYPIKMDLLIAVSGATLSATFTNYPGTGCMAEACAILPAEEIFDGPIPTAKCWDSSTFRYVDREVPPETSDGETALRYAVFLNSAPSALESSVAVLRGFIAPQTPGATCLANILANGLSKRWRLSKTCAQLNAWADKLIFSSKFSDAPGGPLTNHHTINSIVPLNITFHLDPGDVWETTGGSPPPPSPRGKPVSTTLTISEAP